MSNISAKVEDDAYPANDLISDWNQDGDARTLAIARAPAIGGETFDPTLATIAVTFLTSVAASVTAAMIVHKIQQLAGKRGLRVHVEEQGESSGKGEIEIVVRRKY